MNDRDVTFAREEGSGRSILNSVPKVLGPYQILRPLGNGGMSRVYLGEHSRTGQKVALKVLRPELVDKPSAVERFQVEFRAARTIFHPHVIRALDFGVENDLVYLVLEYVDGPCLAQILRDKRILAESQAVRWIAQIAEGVDQAHKHQLIHRDIKPGNILINPQGMAKLADLGLAKDLLAEKELTLSGASLGTLLYMAPELYENARRADPRSDYYSLGVTLYQCLTGRYPFAGGQITVLKNKLTNRFVCVRDLVPEVSHAVDNAVTRLLQADPEKRPGSLEEILALFRSSSSSTVFPPATRSAPPPPPPKDDGANRRRDERYSSSLVGNCSPLLGPREQVWKGAILDLSEGGTHLRVGRRFEVGSLVRVTIVPDDGDEFDFVIRVQWVLPEADGQWRLGGNFHRRLFPSDLERLLDQPLATVVVQSP